MDVRPAGSTPVNIEGLQPPLRGLVEAVSRSAPFGGTPARAIAGDQVAVLLELLAAPEISRLISSGAPPTVPGAAAPLDTMVEAAASAAASGDLTLALTKVREIVTHDPERADSIRSNPSFASIRRDVEEVVRVVTSEARVLAEDRIAASDRAIAVNGSKRLAGSEIDLAAVHTLAAHFFDSGRLPDYVRAANLAQFVITNYAPLREIEIVAGRRPGLALFPGRREFREQMLVRGKALWSRAPLLVLLLGWLALGLAGGLGGLVLRAISGDVFDSTISTLCWNVWAIGFLGLAGFGFYTRVRNIFR